MTSFPWHIYPTVGCWSRDSSTFNFFAKPPSIFPMVANVCSHLLGAQGSLCFRSSPTFVIFSLLCDSHSCRGEALSPCDFDLYFSDEHFITYQVATFTFHFEGYLVKCIAPCKNGHLVCCCWGFDSLCFLDISLRSFPPLTETTQVAKV